MNKYMILGLIGMLLAASARADAARPSGGLVDGMPREGVIVLRQGQVFQGKITRSGDIYHVVSPKSEIRIRAHRVAYHCATLEEAYQRRRGDIRGVNVEAHIELARWCCHNGLYDAARRELAHARTIDPDNPWIAHLERGLNVATRPATLHSDAPGKEISPSRGPTARELDQMVRRMPSETLAAFTSTVQPLLLNNCTAAGCHGSFSDHDFRLLQGHSGRLPTRRATQRNLHAVLEWIDREHPEKSPLLTQAIRPHGSAKSPPFTDTEVMQYRRIVQWVAGVARSAPPAAFVKSVSPKSKPAPAAEPPTTKQAERLPDSVGRTQIATVSHEEPIRGWPSEMPATVNQQHRLPARSPAQRGAQIERFVPADPFDPEIFNRRYHRR